MICSDYETALIDRIAARQIIADRLTPRQRRILGLYERQGYTQKEVAAREGISTGRAGQLIQAAWRRLLHRPKVPPVIAPVAVLRPQTAAEIEFDRAAFLEHMQRVLARRGKVNEALLARERAELDRMLGQVGQKPQPPPIAPPPPKTWPKSLAPVLPLWLPGPQVQPPVQKVEPWFAPGIVVEKKHLHEIALYAAVYFLGAFRPSQPGLDVLGEQTSYLKAPRNADAIAAALMRLAKEIPHGARLSAVPLAVPEGWLCVTAVNRYVAMRVGVNSADEIEIILTWDA